MMYAYGGRTTTMQNAKDCREEVGPEVATQCAGTSGNPSQLCGGGWNKLKPNARMMQAAHSEAEAQTTVPHAYAPASGRTTLPS